MAVGKGSILRAASAGRVQSAVVTPLDSEEMRTKFMTEIRETAENESKKTAEEIAGMKEKTEKRPARGRKTTAKKTAAASDAPASGTARSGRKTAAKKPAAADTAAPEAAEKSQSSSGKQGEEKQENAKKHSGPRDGIYTELPTYLL